MIDRRSTGILLHPTSLPGPYGIGDLGPSAYRFIRFLKNAGVSLWQILPLGPTGYGNSPYASSSSFAGNPMLLSPEILAEEGLLERAELDGAPEFPAERVDFDAVVPWKEALIRTAAERFCASADADARADFEGFREREGWWLDDYALFTVLCRRFGDTPFSAAGGWPPALLLRKPDELERRRAELRQECEIEEIIQYLFDRQWRRLKAAAEEEEIEIIGDLPIFVAPDSADLWAWRDNFLIDGRGRLEFLAGVPPDYFSETGQLWGNPLYDWEAMRADGFRWWFRRIEAALRRVDWIRIDHFRAFQAYWRIPAEAESAIEGEWIEAPGGEFFRALKDRMGDLPIIAEDLGIITAEVHALREAAGLPGMRVLQFAFEFDEEGSFNGDHAFLPHNFEENTVVYTGTHDNDTTAGWYLSRDEKVRDIVRRYCARDGHDIAWDLIRLALSSHAGFAVLPFQDLHSLGSEARMNTPSTVGAANWSWRCRADQINDWVSARLYEMNLLYGRR